MALQKIFVLQCLLCVKGKNTRVSCSMNNRVNFFGFQNAVFQEILLLKCHEVVIRQQWDYSKL